MATKTSRSGRGKRASDEPTTGPARPPREGRLGTRDWIAAGQDLLREEGISSIKLAALTRRLGVSTGSFYHHFTDFEEYLGALAESYSLERVMHDLENALRDSDPSPVSRIKSLGRQSLKAGTFELDRAMRIWATMDPRAEAALRRAEATVLDFITTAFIDLGFGRAEASLRARILLSTNVSPLLPQGEGSAADFFRGCLRLMVSDAPNGDGRKSATSAAGTAGRAPKRLGAAKDDQAPRPAAKPKDGRASKVGSAPKRGRAPKSAA
ncbi:MAG: hypothetical protein RIS35_2566 [Pseudomonadota bacterium]|jgi:AcrR family transcriptional regulator